MFIFANMTAVPLQCKTDTRGVTRATDLAVLVKLGHVAQIKTRIKWVYLFEPALNCANTVR